MQIFEFLSDFREATSTVQMHTPGANVAGYVSLFGVQIVLLIIYWIYVRYNDELLPQDSEESSGDATSQDEGLEEKHVPSYPRECYFITFVTCTCIST